MFITSEVFYYFTVTKAQVYSHIALLANTKLPAFKRGQASQHKLLFYSLNHYSLVSFSLE